MIEVIVGFLVLGFIGVCFAAIGYVLDKYNISGDEAFGFIMGTIILLGMCSCTGSCVIDKFEEETKPQPKVCVKTDFGTKCEN